MALNQAFKWALSFRGATALLLLLMASLSLLAFSNVRVITASGTISAITPQSLQGTKSMAWGREHAAWCKSQHIPMELEAAPLPWETDDPAMSIPDGTRLAVWSIGRGDYFQLAGSALLEAAFPFAVEEVVWTESPSIHCKPGTLSLAIASVFTSEQPWDQPRHFPVVMWSAETRPLPTPPPGYLKPILVLTTRADIPGALYFPQAMHRKLPQGTPPTMRLFGEDDICTRRYAICYVNSNCNAVLRESLYDALRLRLGDDLVHAGGLCHGTQKGPHNISAGIWSSPSLLETYSHCRAVMALENSDIPGYITEKIVNAILSGAVPIQWGAKHHIDTFLELNPKSYIAVGDFPSVDEAAAEIVAVVTNPIRLRAMRNEAVSLNLPALVQKFSYGSSLASSRAAFSDLLVPVRSALMNHWRGQSFMFNESAAGSSGDNNETGLLVD